jgi:hypothetical protein
LHALVAVRTNRSSLQWIGSSTIEADRRRALPPQSPANGLSFGHGLDVMYDPSQYGPRASSQPLPSQSSRFGRWQVEHTGRLFLSSSFLRGEEKAVLRVTVRLNKDAMRSGLFGFAPCLGLVASTNTVIRRP